MVAVFPAAAAAASSPPSQYRWNILRNIRNAIDQNEGGLENFSQGEGGGMHVYVHGGWGQAHLCSWQWGAGTFMFMLVKDTRTYVDVEVWHQSLQQQHCAQCRLCAFSCTLFHTLGWVCPGYATRYTALHTACMTHSAADRLTLCCCQ
jgi:hypothetical protein